jgi:hypothetical protein
MLNLNAYMASCRARDDVRERTVANLCTTDWQGTLVVELEDPFARYPLERHAELVRRILRTAAGKEGIFLFLEDDLDFNRHLLYNLTAWDPLKRLLPRGHFFASLCNLGIPLVKSYAERAYGEASPRAAAGSQALVISQTTAQYLLTCWGVEPGPHADIKILRLAARVGPLFYHLPSLVQHVGIDSLCGGVFHAAADFDKDWKSSLEL